MVDQSTVGRVIALTLVCAVPGASAQQANQPNTARSGGSTSVTSPAAPSDYLIGPDDVLAIVFWHDKDLSADVVVRPDGKISLPLLRDVEAAGHTPEQLRTKLIQAATRYIEDPEATVVVKEIHSRNVFITGNVAKPGTYALSTGMTVLQCIALAGGVLEYADVKNIVVIRRENGNQQFHKFNYTDVVKERHTEQNLELKAGDTIIVP